MSEFRTSTYCSFGDCVEVRRTPEGAVHVHDGKLGPQATFHAFTREEWAAFVAGVKNGEFD